MITGALEYVWHHRGGIAILLIAAFGLMAVVQWLAWIFRFGRFRPAPNAGPSPVRQTSNPLRYVAANFFVEIINDFRHFLALVVVTVFALALAVGMYPGLRNWSVEEIGKGVQAVAAALGGLIGSIIGYYFGESAATQRREDRQPPETQSVQEPQAPGPGITPAPPPPPERTTDTT